MKIRFIKRHKVQQGDGNGPLYETDSVHTFKGAIAETYGRKYVARGYAVEVDADTKSETGRSGRGGRAARNSEPEPEQTPTIEPSVVENVPSPEPAAPDTLSPDHSSDTEQSLL